MLSSSKPFFYFTQSLSHSVSTAASRHPTVVGNSVTPPSSATPPLPSPATSPYPLSPAPAPPTLCHRVIYFLHLHLHLSSAAIAIATTTPSPSRSVFSS